MRCTNCNMPLPDGARTCPVCGAAADTSFVRCPECFVKLKKDTKICPKCGCDIKKSVLAEQRSKTSEKTSVLGRFLKLKLSQKILLISSVLLAVLIVCGGFLTYGFIRRDDYRSCAKEFIKQTEDAVEVITYLAQAYNNIYDGKWLIQTENATDLEKKYAEKIADLEDGRGVIRFKFHELEKKCMSGEEEQLVRKIYHSYDECYCYVVGKNGKYPGYMSGYNAIRDDFEKNIIKLKKNIKESTVN